MSYINKFQSGGSSLPLVDYMPFTGVQAPAAKQAEANDDDIGIKDILKLTNELDGLPVDMDAIKTSLYNMYEDASLFSNGQVSTGQLVNTYLSALQKIKVAKYNKEQFDNAQKEATSNGGLHEVAIDEHGNLFVQDQETGSIGSVSLAQYNKLKEDDPQKYEALTNSNLLYYRAEHPDFAFKNNILRTVSNGVGEKSVTETLSKVLGSLGTDTLTKQGYSEKTAENITWGMEALREAYEQGMTVDGLYKQSATEATQKAQMNAALQYMWKTLPQNMKTFLEYKSGDTENPERGAMKLMADLAFKGTSSTSTYTQSLVKDPNKSGTDGDQNDLKKQIELDPAKALVLGMGYQKDFVLNSGSSYEATLSGNYSVLTDHSGEPLGEFSTLRDVSSGAMAGILDMNNATFGGARIDTLDRAFLNNADVIGVDLPIDQQYLNDTGNIRPDIKLLEKVEQLHTAIKQKVIDGSNPDEVNAYCDKIGLPQMYSNLDDNGIPQLNKKYFARFARVTAMVDESALADGQQVDNTVQEVGDNKRENFKTYMKKENKNYKISDGFFGLGKDELYEGAIYIPIRQDIIAASLAGTAKYKLPGNDAINAASRWADNQAAQDYQEAPTLSELLGE